MDYVVLDTNFWIGLLCNNSRKILSTLVVFIRECGRSSIFIIARFFFFPVSIFPFFLFILIALEGGVFMVLS